MWSWYRKQLFGSPNHIGNGPPNSKTGLIELSSPQSPVVDLVLIHDITEDQVIPWMMPDVGRIWPQEELLPKCLYRVAKGREGRVLIYGYDCGKLETLDDFLCHDRLEQHARDFLSVVPMCSHGIHSGQDGRPVIILAHGYGGLIYEQAMVLSYNDKVSEAAPYWRRQCAFLFGTPHYAAGLAEWAVLSATQVGLLRGETAQSMDWSAFDKNFCGLVHMQDIFRDLCRETLKIAGCFATSPLSNNLGLSSEWVALPEFRAISIHDHHFGMTRVGPISTHGRNFGITNLDPISVYNGLFGIAEHRVPEHSDFEMISTVLSQWIGELLGQAKLKEISRTSKDDPIQALQSISTAKFPAGTPDDFFRLTLSTHNALRGTIQLGSIIQMQPDGGKIMVCATPENIPEHGHINKSDVASVSYRRIQTPAVDFDLWNEFTKPVLPGQDERVFDSILTEKWKPGGAYLSAARRFNLAPLEGCDDPSRNYLVTWVKIVKGARIPTRARGPEIHDDIRLADDVKRLLERRAESSMTPSGDMLIAFSVQELS